MDADASLADARAELVATLARRRQDAIVVSNEVGWSIVPENALARAFRDAQGRLNQRLATEAGLVVAAARFQDVVSSGSRIVRLSPCSW